MNVLIQGGVYFLSALLLLSGLAKLRDAQFEQAVLGYGLLPPGLARVVAKILPSGEVVLALFLALGPTTLPALMTAGFLLFGFAGAIAINLLRGRDLDCGCMGSSAPTRITWLHVAVNVALGTVAVGIAAARVPGSSATLGGSVSIPAWDHVAVFAACVLILVALQTLRESQRLQRSLHLGTEA